MEPVEPVSVSVSTRAGTQAAQLPEEPGRPSTVFAEPVAAPGWDATSGRAGGPDQAAPAGGFLRSLFHPPLRDRRFWAVQAMVALVAAAFLLEGLMPSSGGLQAPSFVWALLLFIPVVYAGMTFGGAGSLGAAASGLLLVTPEELLAPHTTRDLWAGFSILGVVAATALLSGYLFEEQRALAKQMASRAMAEQLAHDEERFRLAFENNLVGMALVDEADRVEMVNRSFCRMIGRTREELLGKSSAWFTHPEDRAITAEEHRQLTSGEATEVHYFKRFVHKDGRAVHVEVSKARAGWGSGPRSYFVVSVKDVSGERALAEKLSYQAHHDPLTGLANRSALEACLARQGGAREGGYCTVLLVDLDDFKVVNDTFGHTAGDQLLVQVAKRLSKVTRKGDTLCRYGGDEFLYLADGLPSPEEAEKIARRLAAVLTQPFALGGAYVPLGASIGISFLRGEACSSFEQALGEADIALYEAKRLGGGHQVRYCPEMKQRLVSNFELVTGLKRALASGGLSMHYQPVVELATLGVVGFEALLRWQGEGAVPPSAFVPVAERSDLIFELGSFALGRAVQDAASWQGCPGALAKPFVSVNLSARQFHDPSLAERVGSLLASSGLAPDKLVLEVTETAALADPEGAAGVVEALRRLKVAVALDDFGTGYSSFSYLSKLRPTIIKVDRSFVGASHSDYFARTLLGTLVLLGQKADITVVAEGIETEEQLAHLRELGCPFGQGYLFSAALPAEQARELLSGSRPGSLAALKPTGWPADGTLYRSGRLVAQHGHRPAQTSPDRAKAS